MHDGSAHQKLASLIEDGKDDQYMREARLHQVVEGALVKIGAFGAETYAKDIELQRRWRYSKTRTYTYPSKQNVQWS